MSKFVAGGYTATWATAALGQTADGFRISHSFFKRLITGDLAADTPQDAIYRGREQFVGFTLIEAEEAGVADLTEPYFATTGVPLALGPIGNLDVQGDQADGTPTAGAVKAKALVLTAVSGTVAANAGPATITFTFAVMAEGFPVEVLYAPDLREIPVRMRVYPDMTSSRFGTVT